MQTKACGAATSAITSPCFLPQNEQVGVVIIPSRGPIDPPQLNLPACARYQGSNLAKGGSHREKDSPSFDRCTGSSSDCIFEPRGGRILARRAGGRRRCATDSGSGHRRVGCLSICIWARRLWADSNGRRNTDCVSSMAATRQAPLPASSSPRSFSVEHLGLLPPR